MNDERMIRALRNFIMFVDLILMLVTVILNLAKFNTIIFVTLSLCILTMTTVVFIFSGALKEYKLVLISGATYVVCFAYLIIQIFIII